MKALIEQLADGRFHSGSELGRALGCSRASVWKQIEALRAMGVAVDAVKGRGYRLRSAMELLDSGRVVEYIPPAQRSLVKALEIHSEVDSTNSYLMGRVRQLRSGHICLAERQLAGRGRRGRAWVSPFGANIYLSISWRFEQGAAGLSGLSLALGVAVAEALEGVGAAGASLKWPNDILWEGQKLAGILVELAGESEGPCDVVLGVGLNLNMPADGEAQIDQPWADLGTIVPGVGRNLVAGRLIGALLGAVKEFGDRGMAAFIDRWRERDAYHGARVVLQLANGPVEGTAKGIAEDGALLLETDGVIRRFAAGELSLRAA